MMNRAASRLPRPPLAAAGLVLCVGLCTGLGGCAAAPQGQQASWPPRLNAASDRMQAVDTSRERQDRAVDESGTTVLLDRPYH